MTPEPIRLPRIDWSAPTTPLCPTRHPRLGSGEPTPFSVFAAKAEKDRRKIERAIARAFWVPEHLVGTHHVRWWRRMWQSWRRRP